MHGKGVWVSGRERGERVGDDTKREAVGDTVGKVGERVRDSG